MHYDMTAVAGTLLGMALAACAVLPEDVESNGLVRYETGENIQLSAGRQVTLSVANGYAGVKEDGREVRLSGLDFETTHALVGDLTGDGTREILIEVLPSLSGSCYELWFTEDSGFIPHEDLFCNPTLTVDGSLVSNEKVGPHTRITEYRASRAGMLYWISRQEPLSPDFARLVRSSDDSAGEVIFLGLPECGEARVVMPHPVRVAETPGADLEMVVTGELLIMEVIDDGLWGELVQVEASDGTRGWLPTSRLGDLEAAAKKQCESVRSATSG